MNEDPPEHSEEQRNFEASTVPLSTEAEASILADGNPAADQSAQQRKDDDRERIIRSYQEILEQKAVYYPVCYRFQRELGYGRQGRVFLCLRQGARGCMTKHAIKVFDPSIYRSAARYWTDMGRIASQVSTLQTIRTPNLASLDTYDEVNGVGYLQMELVNGIDLRGLLSLRQIMAVKAICAPADWSAITDSVFRLDAEKEQVSIQPGVAIYILRMILRGLENLHDAGFVHSDIKPSNIMVNRLGYVQIIDFGRASRANERTRILLGSPMYMSPEAHMRKPTGVKSDLYSVGIVALELLSGRPLVRRPNIEEAELLDIKLALPDRLHTLLPDYVLENEEFMKVLRRLIQPDPAHRFPNAAEAETDQKGLRLVHKQLMLIGQDTDYSRALGHYMGRLLKLRMV